MTDEPTLPGPDASPPLRKGERTRRELLAVAASLFTEQGYAATTYDDLVAASGLSRGGFYFHFRTKEDLAIAVIDAEQRKWEQTLRTRLEPIESPGQRLAAVGPMLLTMHNEDPSAWSLAVMTSELAQIPGLAARAAEVSRRWVEYVRDIVMAAQAEGTVRDDLDPSSVAMVLFASMSGLRNIVTVFDPGDPRASFADHVATLAQMLRSGLLPEPGGNDDSVPDAAD